MAKFDVVVWGATGFTGNLVAQYLARSIRDERLPASFRFALGGRNEGRLNEIKRSLVALCPKCQDAEVLVGDNKDQKSIDEVVKRTKVMISCTGPFMLYGTPIVDACVRLGADYVDITGETPWVKDMIEKYHAAAQQKGVRIVSFCGYDSVPADIGTLLIVDYIKNKLNAQPGVVTGVYQMKGTASGGTIASAMNTVTSVKNLSELRKDLFLLNPPDARPVPTAQDADSFGVSYDKWNRLWTLPFIMAAVNTRAVRRSAAINNYGPNFHYTEKMGVKSLFAALGTTAGLAVFGLLLLVSFTRNILARFLPKPGEGPSAEARKNAWFIYKAVGKSDRGHIVEAEVSGGDPGYDETARMLAESALCMALQRKECPNAAGVLTPASALGLVLVKRLQQSGMKVEVHEVNGAK